MNKTAIIVWVLVLLGLIILASLIGLFRTLARNKQLDTLDAEKQAMKDREQALDKARNADPNKRQN